MENFTGEDFNSIIVSSLVEQTETETEPEPEVAQI